MSLPVSLCCPENLKRCLISPLEMIIIMCFSNIPCGKEELRKGGFKGARGNEEKASCIPSS
jgi:hypothetical protein